MRWQRLLFLTSLALSVCAVSRSHADVVVLKNGGRLEGVIVSDDEKEIVLRVAGLTMRVERTKVAKVIRADVEANEALAKKQKEAEQKAPEARPAPPRPTPRGAADERGEVEDEAVSVATSDGLGFALRLPKAWRSVTATQGALFAAERPEGLGGARLLIATIPTSGQSLVDGGFQRLIEAGLAEKLKGFKLRDKSIKDLGGVGALTLRVEFEVDGEPWRMHLSYVDSGRKLKYLVAFKAPQALYEKLEKAFDECRDSFRPRLP